MTSEFLLLADLSLALRLVFLTKADYFSVKSALIETAIELAAVGLFYSVG